MREIRPYGSVRGVRSNPYPYRDKVHPVRSTVFASPRNRMPDHVFNTCVETVDDTPATGSFGLHSTTPFKWANACRIHSQSCSEFVYSPRRFRNGIARDESMAFVVEISNRRPSGFQVESQQCSTVNGYAGSNSQFGNRSEERRVGK